MLKNSVVTLIFLIILATSSSLFSQINSSYIEMDQYPGQKVPKSLLTKISINLNQVSFEKALETISEKGNFKLNYNRNRIPVEKTVSVNMENVYAMEALLHILKKTGTQLNITKEGNLAIVPLKNDKSLNLSLPTKIIEYQAIGKPIICCSNGAPGNYIERTSSGIRVNCEDFKKFYESIEKLHNDPKLCQELGDNGSNFVKNNLTFDKIGERLEQLIKSLKNT